MLALHLNHISERGLLLILTLAYLHLENIWWKLFYALLVTAHLLYRAFSDSQNWLSYHPEFIDTITNLKYIFVLLWCLSCSSWPRYHYRVMGCSLTTKAICLWHMQIGTFSAVRQKNNTFSLPLKTSMVHFSTWKSTPTSKLWTITIPLCETVNFHRAHMGIEFGKQTGVQRMWLDAVDHGYTLLQYVSDGFTCSWWIIPYCSWASLGDVICWPLCCPAIDGDTSVQNLFKCPFFFSI